MDPDPGSRRAEGYRSGSAGPNAGSLHQDSTTNSSELDS